RAGSCNPHQVHKYPLYTLFLQWVISLAQRRPWPPWHGSKPFRGHLVWPGLRTGRRLAGQPALEALRPGHRSAPKGVPLVIRFRCPDCDKTIKVPDGKAGKAIVCPRCVASSRVPAETAATGPNGGRSAPEAGSRLVTRQGEEPTLLRGGMRPGLRWTLALVAGVGLVSLLLAVVAPVVPPLAALGTRAGYGTTSVVAASLILLMVILHGHGTGCPSCARWWVRRRVETEFVDRAVFQKRGVPFARSTYRTTYECESCRYRWSATSNEEYKD